MNATTWAAWIGACSGLGGLCWNIFTKLSAGPKLRVNAFAGMVMRPKPTDDDPLYLRITVQNIGTQPTTITNVTFYRYGSRWKRFRHRMMSPAAVMNAYVGLQLPQKLEVGAEWTAIMKQDSDFEAWIQFELWCAIHHSFSRHPAEVKIISPVLKSASAQAGK